MGWPCPLDAQEEGQSVQGWGRLLAKPAPAKVKTKSKKVEEGINLQIKKSKQRGERRTKGNQAEVANQEIKPAENRENKNEASPASEEMGEKEAKSD